MEVHHTDLTPIDEPAHEDEAAHQVEEISRLRETIQRLEAENERLKETVDRWQPKPDGDASLEQFMLALAVQRGCTYGWRKDYADATHNTPGSYLVNPEDIQKWQRLKRVPAQAYEQIGRLRYPTRAGRASGKPQWKPSEDDYLLDLCRTEPSLPNAVLAERCSSQFARDIDEPAIKGKKYRLIRAGRLPECDPSNK
jgi:hypothetical protein